MDKTERALELIEQAEHLGVHLEFNSGLAFAVKQITTSDLKGRQDAIIEDLVKNPEVRRLAELRAIALRAKDLIGKKLLFRELQGVDDRTGLSIPVAKEGVLHDGAGDGVLTISIVREGRSQTVTARAADLLIVVDEEVAAASSPGNGEPESAKPRKGIFGWARH
jgi:hypothetical protein